MVIEDDEGLLELAERPAKIWTRNSCVGSSLPYLAVDEMVQTSLKAYKDTGTQPSSKLVSD